MRKLAILMVLPIMGCLGTNRDVYCDQRCDDRLWWQERVWWEEHIKQRESCPDQPVPDIAPVESPVFTPKVKPKQWH